MTALLMQLFLHLLKFHIFYNEHCYHYYDEPYPAWTPRAREEAEALADLHAAMTTGEVFGDSCGNKLTLNT